MEHEKRNVKMWDDNANFSVTKYDHLQMKVVISENARVVAEILLNITAYATF